MKYDRVVKVLTAHRGVRDMVRSEYSTSPAHLSMMLALIDSLSIGLI